MQHRDETDSMFKLIGQVISLAVKDYIELERLGLVQGDRVVKTKWPRAKAKGSRFYVMTESGITIREAEYLNQFLFKGGAKKFFWTFGLEPDVDQIVSRLIGEMKEAKSK